MEFNSPISGEICWAQVSDQVSLWGGSILCSVGSIQGWVVLSCIASQLSLASCNCNQWTQGFGLAIILVSDAGLSMDSWTTQACKFLLSFGHICIPLTTFSCFMTHQYWLIAWFSLDWCVGVERLQLPWPTGCNYADVEERSALSTISSKKGSLHLSPHSSPLPQTHQNQRLNTGSAQFG